MKVLVTGSSGKLGSATVKNLLLHNHQAIGIDLIPAATTHHIIDNNKPAIEAATQQADAVIHTAALHGKHYDLNFSREYFIRVNINGTLNLLNACVKNKVKRFLYIRSIYGNALLNNNAAVWVNEHLQVQPRDIYDITKQAAEALCNDFYNKEGLHASVYRVGRFLPEHPNLEINHRLYRGLDERDGAEALRLALAKTFDRFEIFNIASGSPFKSNDLELLKYNPKQVILKYFPEAAAIYHARGWEFPPSIDRVYDTGKAEQMLGYTPYYTFKYLLDRAKQH